MTAKARTRKTMVRAVVAVIASVGLYLSWSAERASVERANRLQRSGRIAEAASLYRARTEADPTAAALRYNLGTSLAELDSADAEMELARAFPARDAEVRIRAQYNTGLLRLDRALRTNAPDSVREHAAASVAANRAALRLRPENDDAKWNLAMAVRLLDSIDSFERRSGREMDDGAVEADVVTRSVNVPDAAEDERAEDPPAEGENETVAVGGDETPLSPEEAEEILGRTHLDATDILTKLLALEGRSRWGRRPSPGVRRW